MKIDYRRLEAFVKNEIDHRHGGDRSAPICDDHVHSLRVLVVENSEPALHAVLEMLAAKQASARIDGRLADIRDRNPHLPSGRRFPAGHRVPRGGAQARAAARAGLGEGVKTNVFGTVNVADAAAAARRHGDDLNRQGDRADIGARRFKRFAEMYCQALDADLARRRNGERRCA